MTAAWLLFMAGAGGVALLVASALWHDRAESSRGRLAAMGAGWICLLLALLLLDFSVPTLVNSYFWQIIIKVGIYITLAVSLNIINGIAGQFSMGHAGFMAIGAYAAAYLTMNLGAGIEGWARYLPWNAPWTAFSTSRVLEGLPAGSGPALIFVIALLAGGVAAGFAGYLVGIPSLRLRGDYLAIVTLGFGEIIRNLIANVEIIGASRGLPAVPHYSNLFWVYFFAALVIFVSYRLLASVPGRAMLAVREDEIAAAAMGIDTTRTKIQAFVIGTFFAGVAGGLLAHHFEYLHPDYFKFDKSFEVIIIVVLGGMGSVSGSAIAAVLLALAPEILRYAKDLLGNLTEPSVLYAAAPFMLFALIFFTLFSIDTVRKLGLGAARLVSGLRLRARGGATHADIVRLRRGGRRSTVSLLPAAVALGPRAMRDAGLGALGALVLAIVHRGLIGTTINPRAHYAVMIIGGLAIGAAVGRWGYGGSGGGSVRPAAGKSRAQGGPLTHDKSVHQGPKDHGLPSGGGTPPGGGRVRVAGPGVGYRRLAAVGLLAPIAWGLAYGMEFAAPAFLERVSIFFRGFPDPRMVLYSIMLIALMLTRPTGLFGSSEVRTWWRERHGRAGSRP